jgi:hypothetical protein
MYSGTGNNNFKRVWAAEKKKLITAACLVLLMIFMWMRILTGSGPEETEASIENTPKSDEKSDIKIEFLELPEIVGRNDSIVWNCFNLKESSLANQSIRKKEDRQINDNGNLEKLKNKLVLEAIEHGDTRMAFLNDTFCCEGDILKVKLDGQIYKLEVIKIDSEKVVLGYSGNEFVIRLR